MPNVVVLKPASPEVDGSPELRYLLGHVLLQAERAFGSTVLVRDGDELPECDAVLRIGDGNVLVGEASLRAMRAALEEAEVVVPTRLAEAGESRPVYTLRGFEREEAAFLERGGARGEAALEPLALLRPEAVGRPLEELRVARAGLFHEFIDYYGEVRSDVVPYLPRGAREVLEVGCGRGATGAHLQAATGCRVTGVELNPAVAGSARERLHRVVVGDVEDAAVAAEIGDGYDALLALELFEHLVDQEGFLAHAKRFVRPGGRIVLSVPNVGHHSVVEDLLAGRWDYLPIGILCYTHYRFFTKRTLDDWLARCGFRQARLVPQHTEGPGWEVDLPTDEESLRTKGFYVLIDL
jgi:SAM-dependent methyltransferase